MDTQPCERHEMNSQSGDAPQGLEVELTPDGVLRIGLSARGKDVRDITDIVDSMCRACQDDTFGMYDKIRAQEAHETVEEETVNVKVEMSITKINIRRAQRERNF